MSFIHQSPHARIVSPSQQPARQPIHFRKFTGHEPACPVAKQAHATHAYIYKCNSVLCVWLIQIIILTNHLPTYLPNYLPHIHTRRLTLVCSIWVPTLPCGYVHLRSLLPNLSTYLPIYLRTQHQSLHLHICWPLYTDYIFEWNELSDTKRTSSQLLKQ